MSTPDFLSASSLEWALAHIKRFGDTDLLPVPFEYEAIRHSWLPFRDYACELDLENHEARPARRFLIPKGGFNYRVAVQLDPIDTLLFTALAYELAPLVEQIRTPRDRRVACSYRVAISPEGDLFRKDSGWNDFHARARELAHRGEFKFVFTADIADFYNQIGHHRVRNALELAGVNSTRARNVEHMLMNFTGGQSRGIPVGPAASAILAEACLADVDSMLLRKGYTHTRFVDDFRIFCTSEEQAWRALQDLTEYLYTAHRLTLQAHKTRLMSTQAFRRTELIDPESLETSTIEEKLEAIADLIATYGDESDFEDVDQNRIVRDNLAELFEFAVEDDPPHYGLAKYLLRRAASLRSRVLRDSVLANLENLIPVYRETIQYLAATNKGDYAIDVGQRLIAHATSSKHKHANFIHEWAADFLVKKCLPDLSDDVLRYVQENEDKLGIRQVALVARIINSVDWVRERKETWQNNGPWDRRAVLWASQALSTDEMGFWLKRVQNTGDILDRAIASAASALRVEQQSKPAVQEAELRATTLKLISSGTEWLTFEQLSEQGGKSKTSINRWTASHKVFAVSDGKTTLFPRYAFTENFTPVPQLAEILKIFSEFSSLRVAAWFESTSSLLDGRRPRELLTSAPERVIELAKETVAAEEFGV